MFKALCLYHPEQTAKHAPSRIDNLCFPETDGNLTDVDGPSVADAKTTDRYISVFCPTDKIGVGRYQKYLDTISVRKSGMDFHLISIFCLYSLDSKILRIKYLLYILHLQHIDDRIWVV